MELRQWKIIETNGVKISTNYWIGDADLPYPFTGLEEVVKKSHYVKMLISIDNIGYELQTAHVDIAPQYAFGAQPQA